MLMINEEQEAINSFMSDFMTAFAIILAVIFLIMLIGYIVWKVAYWKIFSKAGEKGWKSLIPIYDQYVLCRIVGVSPWWLLICAASGILSSISGFFATLFAAVSIYFFILVAISLARSFDKSDGFGIVTFFFRVICFCILAFDKSKYLGPKPLDDIIMNSIINNNSANNNVTNNNSNATQDIDNFKFCSSCGAKVSKDSEFCTNCGKKFD